MGFADIIADITSTGTTMKENQLKTIQGGTIIESEACLIGNTNKLLSNITKLNTAKQFIKTITGYFEGLSTGINVRHNL